MLAASASGGAAGWWPVSNDRAAPQPSAPLVDRTQLDIAPSVSVGRAALRPDRWAATVYEEAGEGTYWRVHPSGLVEDLSDPFGPTVTAELAPDPEAATDARAADPLAGADRARSARRARGRLRRYLVTNGCNKLWTLTYRGQGQHDRRQVVRDVQAFGRRLRSEYPGTAWAYVLELHPGGHGWHVHFSTGRYLDVYRVRRMWPHGERVDVTRFRGGRREQARGVARYLSKYIAKELGEGLEAGEHSYEVAQGHRPIGRRVYAFGDRETARAMLVAAFWGEVPGYEWSSGDSEDWTGPPCGFASWV